MLKVAYAHYGYLHSLVDIGAEIAGPWLHTDRLSHRYRRSALVNIELNIGRSGIEFEVFVVAYHTTQIENSSWVLPRWVCLRSLPSAFFLWHQSTQCGFPNAGFAFKAGNS